MEEIGHRKAGSGDLHDCDNVGAVLAEPRRGYMAAKAQTKRDGDGASPFPGPNREDLWKGIMKSAPHDNAVGCIHISFKKSRFP